MNQVPENGSKTNFQTLQKFTSSLLQKAGMNSGNADFLSGLLVKNDLRGVFSHGSVQAANYSRIIRDGLLNPNPEVSMESSSLSTLTFDGDGGLGYFAAHEAAERLAEMCLKTGIAAATTRNHGHFGAAGIYAKLLAGHNLFGYVTSGHELTLSADQSIMRAAGGSPMSFALPSGNEPPMILDFGAMHDLYQSSPHVSELFQMAPGLVFRSMGLGFMCQALGGILAGIPIEGGAPLKKFKGANQGSLMIALDISRFVPIDQFKKDMDGYMNAAGKMQPMPGYDRATLPGVLEAERELDWSKTGIPLSVHNMETLTKAGAEFGLAAPF